jgi:pyruvate,water dikinase
MAHSILYRVLLHFVVLLRGPDEARALVDALCAALETRTALVNRELAELVRLAASEPALRDGLLAGAGRAMLEDGRIAAHPIFAARLARFLEDYGHREIDIDYYLPTWSGQPWVVLDQLASLLRAGDPPTHGERERAQRLRQFEAEQALLANAPRELGFFLHELIRLARVYAGLDDLEHFETTRLNAEGHRTATELGARLYAAGLVERLDDVFFFARADLDQLVAAFPHAPENGYRSRVAAARERYQLALAQSPSWKLHETTDHRPPTTDEQILYGIAGSPGVVTGPVFQVRGSDDFGRFPAGAILVARTTNPAWTPLFYSAAGVVVESGGPLSHGAVTARELGLPAVMAVRGALAALHDGQQVRVDGARGEVELLR